MRWLSHQQIKKNPGLSTVGTSTSVTFGPAAQTGAMHSSQGAPVL